MARTQEERRAETRALLLDAASDLFAHKGFHATSAEAVAAAAGRTTGALYDHFGGKEGLLVALLERWVERRIVDISEVIEGVDALGDRLGAMWEGVVVGTNGANGPDGADGPDGEWLLLEIELWLHAVRDPELGMVGAERFGVMRDGLAGALVEWAERYDLELPAGEAELATQLIGLLLGAAFQHRLDPAAVPQAAVVDGLQRLLGLSAPAT
ncbi:MAG: TetR/AcrR family transcriptional regulator [Acidimicrobiales bacterium]|nr:TetR/AcrR family transcriptional regulator [Acidimicrobiales bacterium]